MNNNTFNYTHNLLFIIILITLYYCTAFKTNVTKTDLSKFDETKSELLNLFNANTFVNLPNLVVNTSNIEIKSVVDCATSAVFLGELNYATKAVTESNCFTACGSHGIVIDVTKHDELYYNKVRLKPGVWCTTTKIDCNQNTGYLVAGINTPVCHSKYPNMFGGANAMKIIACSNEQFPEQVNVLWDYKYNVAVNPSTVIMDHEDELLETGEYRFRCKFGRDVKNNLYIQHPNSRLQVIENPCTKHIYNASSLIRYDEKNKSCDCGDYEETRVMKYENICTSCIPSISAYSMQLPYDCFKLDSPQNVVYSQIPCNPSKFTNVGNYCDHINIFMEPDSYKLPGIDMNISYHVMNEGGIF